MRKEIMIILGPACFVLGFGGEPNICHFTLQKIVKWEKKFLTLLK